MMDSILESLIEVINLAQLISDNGFDTGAFIVWKGVALATLIGLVGPFHYYTTKFRQFTSDASRNGLLAGEGVLCAVREHLVSASAKEKRLRSEEDKGVFSIDVPWISQNKKWQSLDFLKRLPWMQ